MSVKGAAIEILKSEFHTRKSRNTRYSLRAFAKYLGLSHSVLSLVLSGKRSLSRKTTIKIIERLNLPSQDAMVLFAASVTTKKASAKPDYQVLDLSMLGLLSDWVYFAILSLFETLDAQAEPKWIAKRLGISERRAKASFARLVEMGFLEKRQGRWRQAGKSIQFGNSISTSLTKSFNRELLGKAIESLERDSMEIRSLSSTIFAVDPRFVPYAVKRIRAFRQKLSAELEAKGATKEVYGLTVQLFPLTRGVQK